MMLYDDALPRETRIGARKKDFSQVVEPSDMYYNVTYVTMLVLSTHPFTNQSSLSSHAHSPAHLYDAYACSFSPAVALT